MKNTLRSITLFLLLAIGLSSCMCYGRGYGGHRGGYGGHRGGGYGHHGGYRR